MSKFEKKPQLSPESRAVTIARIAAITAILSSSASAEENPPIESVPTIELVPTMTAPSASVVKPIPSATSSVTIEVAPTAEPPASATAPAPSVTAPTSSITAPVPTASAESAPKSKVDSLSDRAIRKMGLYDEVVIGGRGLTSDEMVTYQETVEKIKKEEAERKAKALLVKPETEASKMLSALVESEKLRKKVEPKTVDTSSMGLGGAPTIPRPVATAESTVNDAPKVDLPKDSSSTERWFWALLAGLAVGAGSATYGKRRKIKGLETENWELSQELNSLKKKCDELDTDAKGKGSKIEELQGELAAKAVEAESMRAQLTLANDGLALANDGLDAICVDLGALRGLIQQEVDGSEGAEDRDSVRPALEAPESTEEADDIDFSERKTKIPGEPISSDAPPEGDRISTHSDPAIQDALAILDRMEKGEPIEPQS